MTELGETIATTIDDLERTKRGIDSSTGSIYRYNIFTDTVTIDDTYFVLRKRGIGSSFILGHAIDGKMGTQSPQPILGDSTVTSWQNIIVYSGATAP